MRLVNVLTGVVCLGAFLFLAPAACAIAVAGDVDSSGEVDAVDVQLDINAALGISVTGQPDIDQDTDHTANAVDVQLVINAALGIDIDSDDDGLSDAAEENLGTTSGDTDSDDDGIGDGDEIAGGTDPLVPDAEILIEDIDELQKIGNDEDYPLNGNYALANDIDASSTTSTVKGALGFSPIGTSDNPFVGKFDGKGFTISGFFINRPDQDLVGLFGQVGEASPGTDGGRIENVNLSGGTIVGRNNTGALCGSVVRGEVTDCHSGEEVTGNQNVGGLIGLIALDVTVDSCSTTGAVFSPTIGDIGNQADAIGGLVGWSAGTIAGCTASGSVGGFPHATASGGLVGLNDGFISNCSASGDVNIQTPLAGGLVGINFGTIADCQSTGNVNAFSDAGGLVGENELSLAGIAISITRSRATGNVTAIGRAGGLIGSNADSTVTECIAEGNVVLTGFPNTGDVGGGLIGLNTCNSTHPIRDCYALGSVTGRIEIGGLVGKENNAGGGQGDINSFGPIIHCYAAGAISAVDFVGGLVGKIAGTSDLTPVSESFWDVETTGLGSSQGGGTGLTTVQMMAQSNFEGAGFDFAGTWGIDEGTSYPFLLWPLNVK